MGLDPLHAFLALAVLTPQPCRVSFLAVGLWKRGTCRRVALTLLGSGVDRGGTGGSSSSSSSSNNGGGWGDEAASDGCVRARRARGWAALRLLVRRVAWRSTLQDVQNEVRS